MCQPLIIFRMRGSSTGSTKVVPRRFLLRFGDFLVRMWLLNAFFRRSRPVPVVVKRFFAPLFDFILGMILPFFGRTRWYGSFVSIGPPAPAGTSRRFWSLRN